MVYVFMILNPSIRPQEKRPPGFSTDEPHPLQAAPKSRSESNSDEIDEENADWQSAEYKEKRTRA